MADELEMQPLVARIFLTLRRIRKLAAGVERRDETQPGVVPRANLEDALALARSVHETIQRWASRVDFMRGQGWGGIVSGVLYGAVESGSADLVRVLTIRLERPLATSIEPIHIQVLISYDSRIVSGRELLLVLSGELAWNDSPLSAISRSFNGDVDAFTAAAVDITLSMLPGVGPIYDVATGVLGFRLPDAHRLTNTERTLRVLFVGAGAILGLLVKGARVSARTLLIMQAGSYSKVLNASIKRINAFKALAVSFAKMKPEMASRLVELAKLIKRGEVPDAEQLELLLSFLQAVNQTATAAHWAMIAKTPGNIVGNVGGVHVLKYVTLKEGEAATFAALRKHWPNAEIISLPELSPGGYERVTQGLTGFKLPFGLPKLSQVQRAKHPDLAIEGGLADIFTPERDTFAEIVGKIAGKSSQAPTVVVNMDRSRFTTQQVLQGLPKVWAEVGAFDLQRVILLDSKGFFQIVNRPINFRVGEIFTIPVQTLENLREIWNELDKEDAAQAAK